MKRVQELLPKIIFGMATVIVASSIDVILGAIASLILTMFIINLIDDNFNRLQERIIVLEVRTGKSH